MLRKDFHQSSGPIRALLASMAALAFANASQAASPDTAQALDLITNTADKICNVVTTKGETESTQVNGQVKAELSGLASRLANVGISGSGSITHDQYQNVLRQDLAATLHDNAKCKLKVFEDLQVKLIPEASTERTPTPPAPQVPAPNLERPIAWIDAVAFMRTGDVVNGFELQGTVINPTPVQLTDAYVISDTTGERVTLDVELRPGSYTAISEVNAIPSKAVLRLWAIFSPPGISPLEFGARWGSFRLHVDYSGIKPDEKVWPREVVENFLQANWPELGPHVTTKIPPRK